MLKAQFRWLQTSAPSPDLAWRQAVATAAGEPEPLPETTAQLLWQRGWQDPQVLGGFLNPDRYVSTPPWAFGGEMELAISRLIQARDRAEKVAIWGDFDADGLTATAVLWEGLGQFFPQHQALKYFIPNRFTESHGLSHRGLDHLAAWGCNLIVTCDTGSTAHRELDYAQELGIEVIVTDHHTLPETRPPVVALINPRQLPPEHPLADLSGVAVAYKLLEALYERLPGVAQQPLATLLDLVAIGLIADLVALRGDCRYLAQVGLRTLERQAKEGLRPGISKLLELCKRTGDRPSDVAFGLGPRINAVSRIHGDASFGVELLTSRERPQAEALALEAELANTRRKDLQAQVLADATTRAAQLDLATTQVIVLADPQWSPGILGLVASQLAQTYGRPAIMFQTDLPIGDSVSPAENSPVAALPMARGSARSVNGIDLYGLVQDQAHLLTRFGGHPFAAGLSLPLTNLDLFIEGINRSLRSHQASESLTQMPSLTVDLAVTVADLGQDLFRALKRLEPYGMGNPTPRLLLRNVQFTAVKEHAIRDSLRPAAGHRNGGKQRFYKVEFRLQDESDTHSFPGHWWGHRRDEVPETPCDVVVELDVNFYRKPAQYEVRLIDLQSTVPETTATAATPGNWILDQRSDPPPHPLPPAVAHCPADWSEFPPSPHLVPPLTLAYPLPDAPAPEALWQDWVGLAKYLARTETPTTLTALSQRLTLSLKTITVGLDCLKQLGFTVNLAGAEAGAISGSLHIGRATETDPTAMTEDYSQIAYRFLQAVREEQFRRRYFYQVSPAVVQQVLVSR
ncbi:single-stranded-DNA-specific exonuclease RecJ [Leptolyngbya sp. PCC 6406]|uniref:single-stranded-DNA-specific exonuclease RecJ n=1 Tax=Leptolyngbya sp. PCC 6406 TaxID=1173264 RepID=UPI0002ABC3D1|nr:single-stranded-DNA-specific exonuclease RecJ [Leptolyngbya sp. PCC 6406]